MAGCRKGIKGGIIEEADMSDELIVNCPCIEGKPCPIHKKSELLTKEEIQIIIRQHNEARIKPSRTELALIEAQLAKFKGWKSPKEVEEAIKEEREKVTELLDHTLVSHILQDGKGDWSIESWRIKAFFKRWQALKSS